MRGVDGNTIGAGGSGGSGKFASLLMRGVDGNFAGLKNRA